MELFTDKYQPTTFDNIVLNEEVRTMFKEMKSKNNLSNLILYGKQGIGKTTISKIISKEFNAIELYISCAYDNSVEMVRNKVVDFCNSMGFDDRIKLVILDEADSLRGTSGSGTSAQLALKNIIQESSSDTRFILTCNSVNKIIEPLQSRCIPIDISNFSLKDVISHILNIAKIEIPNLCVDDFKKFIEVVIKPKYPDIRYIVGKLQSCICDGRLNVSGCTDKDKYSDVINFIINTQEPRLIREHLIKNDESFFRNYIELAQTLFNKVEDYNDMIIIADHIYRMHIVSDIEIEFYTMILKLKNKKV